jgi:O-antigen ligase
LLLAFTFFSAVTHAVRLLRRRPPAGSPRPEILPFVLTCAAFLGTVLVSLNTEMVWRRFAGLLADPAAAAQDRRLAREAATEMLADRWVLGWGAGGFRHAFPLYAQKYPAIYSAGGEGRKLWEHAHNDLLEFPLELGVVGLLPILVILGHGAWQGGRRRGRRNAVTVSLLLGCGLLLLHAGVDFVLQNPAVLLTAGVLFVALQRWADLDELKPVKPPA